MDPTRVHFVDNSTSLFTKRNLRLNRYALRSHWRSRPRTDGGRLPFRGKALHALESLEEVIPLLPTPSLVFDHPRTKSRWE